MKYILQNKHVQWLHYQRKFQIAQQSILFCSTQWHEIYQLRMNIKWPIHHYHRSPTYFRKLHRNSWESIHLHFRLPPLLTHWGRVTHICVGNLTIIGLDNGLSPGRRQAIIWTKAGILSIGPSGTNFSKILIEILTFSFKKMCLNVSSAKWRPFCLRLNVLKHNVK